MINVKITWLLDSVAAMGSTCVFPRMCSEDVRAVVALGLHYTGKVRHCLALLLMDDAVMERRWVTDRSPDGESEG